MNGPAKPLSNFNFKIESSGYISGAFKELGITDFEQAASFIKQLPYKRNKNKDDLRTVLTDGFGTCSTKHALLKLLATENGIEGVELILCIFKMNPFNTPKIAATLKAKNLAFMLEAHNYLLVNGTILDCTNAKSCEDDFLQDTISTIAIEPSQITDYKVSLHKEALQQWLIENSELRLTLEELFSIREKCIADLQA